MARPICQQCGGRMIKTTISTGNYVGIMFALVVFIVGFTLLFAFPIGSIIGVLLMLAALGMGGKRRKV